jgi:hypothetical protein
LAQSLRAAHGEADLLRSRDVADALSRFLLPLRSADARSDGGCRFSRDDGIILLRASSAGRCFELFGYIWWISQDVDPLWAQVEIDGQGESVSRYVIKCGVRKRGASGSSSFDLKGRHLRKVLETPHPDDIEKAWFSGQLVPALDIWFFEFRYPGDK